MTAVSVSPSVRESLAFPSRIERNGKKLAQLEISPPVPRRALGACAKCARIDTPFCHRRRQSRSSFTNDFAVPRKQHFSCLCRAYPRLRAACSPHTRTRTASYRKSGRQPPRPWSARLPRPGGREVRLHPPQGAGGGARRRRRRQAPEPAQPRQPPPTAGVLPRGRRRQPRQPSPAAYFIPRRTPARAHRCRGGGGGGAPRVGPAAVRDV